jgi:hypothetical protein
MPASTPSIAITVAPLGSPFKSSGCTSSSLLPRSFAFFCVATRLPTTLPISIA